MAFENADNFAAYEQYLRHSREWHEVYRGIDLVEAMAAEIINFTVARGSASWYLVVCTLLRRLHTDDILKAFEQHKNVFTYDAPRRRDHRKLSELIQSSVADSQRVELRYFYRPWGVILPFLKNYLTIAKRVEVSFVNRCYLAALMTSYKVMIRQLDKTFKNFDVRGKSLIPFCSPAYVEALLTLFFKSKGVKTYSTVHGYFGRYKQFIAADVVNGCNILADKVLCFSQNQKEDLIRDFDISADRIFVAGNPKYPKREIQFKSIYKNGLIVGGIAIYDNDLRRLFPQAEQVAEKLGLQFWVRPHPQSRITQEELESYGHINMADSSQTLVEILKSGEYDFAITHNTSAYYECLYYGVRAFRWGVNENLMFEPLEESVQNAQQLSEVIERTCADKQADEERAEQLLVRNLGMGINLYDEILNAN